jgi:hypothetical protein
LASLDSGRPSVAAYLRKLAADPASGVSWRNVAYALGKMDQRSVLSPPDKVVLDYARKEAILEAASNSASPH